MAVAAKKEMGMIIDRIGNWAWALTPAERLVSVTVTAAQREGTPVGTRLAQRYEAMRTKQAKLLARGFLPSGPQGFGQASRRADTASARIVAPPVPESDATPALADWGAERTEDGADESID
jgi:hypothetical protein